MKKSFSILISILVAAALVSCEDNTANTTQEENYGSSNCSSVSSQSLQSESSMSANTSSARVMSEKNYDSTSANESQEVKSAIENTHSSDLITSSQESDNTSSNEMEQGYDPSFENVVSAEEVESSLSGYENEIVGTWKSEHILDKDLNEVNGEELFGKAYRQYGGSLSFNDDGSFLLSLGVSGEDEANKGNYTYLGGRDIELLYSNDSLKTCKRVYVNGSDAIAMEIDLFGDIFTIYFMK